MRHILADCSASITELKKNPSALIAEANDEVVAILNHNKPAAYLVPALAYELMMDRIEDYELGLLVEKRETEKHKAKEVELNEL